LNKDASIMILGAGGMVGSACLRAFQRDGWTRIVTPQRHLWDLTRQHRAEECIRTTRPDVIVMAAGKVGGIGANMADQSRFLYQNAMMAMNVIHAAKVNGVERVIYLGSSCAYPKHAVQPYHEEQLLTGPFEPTNAGYALAKCLGAEMCRHYSEQYGVRYTCLMPCNLYGPGDNYTETGHVVGMLMKRFHDAVMTGAETVTLWGSGTPVREFMHVDDLASAVVHLMGCDDVPPLVNIGSGEAVSIKVLAGIIAKVTGFNGTIRCDRREVDGVSRKVMSSAVMRNLGWSPQIELFHGLRQVYAQEFPALVEVA